MKTGEAIKYVMEKNKITYSELQKITGCSYSTMSNLASPDFIPRRKTIEAVLKAIHIDMYDLLVIMHGDEYGRNAAIVRSKRAYRKELVERKMVEKKRKPTFSF